MFFVQRGVARVIKGRGTKEQIDLGEVKAGSFFGEVALTAADGLCRRGATVISSTLLVCLKLHRAVLDDVAVDFPHLMMQLRATANKRRRELGDGLHEFSGLAVNATLTTAFVSKLKGLARKRGGMAHSTDEPDGSPSLCNRILKPLRQQKTALSYFGTAPGRRIKAALGRKVGVSTRVNLDGRTSPPPAIGRFKSFIKRPMGMPMGFGGRVGGHKSIASWTSVDSSARAPAPLVTHASKPAAGRPLIAPPDANAAAIVIQKSCRGMMARKKTREVNMPASRTVAEMMNVVDDDNSEYAASMVEDSVHANPRPRMDVGATMVGADEILRVMRSEHKRLDDRMSSLDDRLDEVLQHLKASKPSGALSRQVTASWLDAGASKGIRSMVED